MGLCISCSTSSAAENDFAEKKLADLKSYYNTTVILRLQEDENEINNKVNGNVLAVSTPGLLLSVYSQQGSKGLNQDAATIHEGYGAEKDGMFVGVYDGHGMNGHIVSRLIRDRLSNLLLNLKNARGSSDQMMEDNTFESQNNEEDHCNTCSVDECFTNAFKAMDKEIKLLQDVDCCISGSTAVVVVKQGDDLAIANLGDSRAVMVTKTENGRMETTQLTTDMKPNLPEEADRIRKLNGRVFALEEESHIQRVWMPEQDYPGLAMTRSFGDFDLKKHGVVSIPKVNLHKLTSRDQFLVLATDGVWDVMSNDQVATAVLGSKTQEEAAKTVVNEARLAWKRRFPSAKVDDCTVACLFFLTS